MKQLDRNRNMILTLIFCNNLQNNHYVLTLYQFKTVLD